MKIPRNITYVRELNTTYLDPSSNLIVIVPSLAIDMLPGAQSTVSDLSFTWKYTKWTEKTIEIQLNFKTP